MALDLATAQAQLDAWITANTAVASNQSYTINGRSVTRADAGLILSQINYWQSMVSQFQRQANGEHKIGFSKAVFK